MTLARALAGVAVLAMLAMFAPNAVADATTAPVPLTIQLTRGPGTSGDETLLVEAAGPAPTSSYLISKDGTVQLRASPLPTAECSSEQKHYTGLGSTPWCLKVTGVVPATAATGTLMGASASVALTLNVRNPWFPWPTIVALLGLLVAATLLYFSGTAVPDWVAQSLLDSRVRRDVGTIENLENWLRDSAGHLTKADQLARVTWMERYGLQSVHGLREKLSAALAQAVEIPPPAPLHAAARTEADKAGGPVDASDMVGTDGKVATSPAEQLLTLVNQAHKQIDDWNNQLGALLPHITCEEHRKQADALIGHTRALFPLLSASMIDDVGRSMRTTLERVALFVQQDAVAESAAMLTAAVAIRAAGRPLAATAADPAPAGGVAVGPLAGFGRTAAVGLFTLALVTLLMLVAAATALTTTYFPNTTFGSATDYLTLFTGAFASAGVAGVLGVVLAWTKASSWRG
ncbi:MAG: hypothetical protein JO057_24465 [Chloroflexi bacterium]|nr:hypothetical protein [Chloroflexota bacterium]